MVDMAVLFGADRSRAEKELKDCVNFEMALANVRNFTWPYTFFVIIIQS